MYRSTPEQIAQNVREKAVQARRDFEALPFRERVRRTREGEQRRQEERSVEIGNNLVAWVVFILGCGVIVLIVKIWQI